MNRPGDQSKIIYPTVIMGM